MYISMTAIKYTAPDDVDNMFNEIENLQDDFWKISEIRKNTKNLVVKNHVVYDSLNNILHLKDLCDRKKYREFLTRRNDFLEKHQLMNANEFAQLFWNNNLKNKKVDNDLISGKYNKSDINQWKLWICIFDTFLRQLKETPFFETLIRCSLQRNDKNNWRKCLIPFCNNEWNYEEISDEDISYLKKTKIWDKEMISNSSLWFNILETLLVKMVWNNDKYPYLASGFDGFHYRSWSYSDLKTLDAETLELATYWVIEHKMRDYFLWKDIIRGGICISDFNDEELEFLLQLSQSWIIKLNIWTIDEKIHNYIKNNIPNFENQSSINDNIDENSNEKTLIERWYPLKVLYQAWPDEDVSIWKAKKLWMSFKIKWTKEWFVQWHAYSIAGMHKKGWETFVTIINPWYTWKKIDVPFRYIKEFFTISVFWFDTDKMFIEKNNITK